MKDTVNNPHNGSSFDDFLQEESLYEECSLIAIKQVLARQVMEKMKQLSLTKIEMAEQMQTSQEKLEELLDTSKTEVSLDTIQKAASLLGRQLKIELV